MKLLIEDEQGNRSVVPVIRDEITIGRKEDNTIRLTERNVSRHHARLLRQNGELYIEDVEARYGVTKNGQEIDDRTEFTEGDVVLIGDYRLTLRPEQAKDAEPADGEEVAAEFDSDLQEASLDQGPPSDQGSSGPQAPIEKEPTQVQKKDDVEGAPTGGGSAGTEERSAAASSETQIIETEPAELVVVSSNFAGQEFPLDRDEMVVGRGEDCDIIIDHRSVSNTHAKIIREGPEEYKIVDLNSRNGIKIDGDEYKSSHLERGDIIELGHVKFRFVEPGENYVFSPQQQADEPVPDVATDDSSSGMVSIAVGATVLVAGLVVGFYLLSGDGSEETSRSDDEPSSTASTDQSGTDEPASQDAGTGGGKVESTLKRAENYIENGELERAVSSLKTARDLIEPSNDKNDRIDELIAKAKNEEPHLKHYEDARDALDDEDWATALEKLAEIPEFSTFDDLVSENDMRSRAVDGAMKRAESLYEEESYEEAETLASLAAQSKVQTDRPAELLEKIEKAREGEGKERDKIAQNSNTDPGESATANDDPQSEDSTEDDERSANSGSNADDGETDSTGGSSGQGGGEDRGISASQAKGLYDSAMSKYIDGNPGGAIADCTRALRAGYTQCHRVLGMAYKKKGRSGPACRHFQSYLATDPADASRIQSVMSDMNCE